MLSDIPSELLAKGVGSGLVTVAVLLVLFGLLVPRRALRDVQRERDEWRRLALSAMSQNGQLIDSARVVNDVLKALPRPTGREDDGAPE